MEIKPSRSSLTNTRRFYSSWRVLLSRAKENNHTVWAFRNVHGPSAPRSNEPIQPELPLLQTRRIGNQRLQAALTGGFL